MRKNTLCRNWSVIIFKLKINEYFTTWILEIILIHPTRTFLFGNLLPKFNEQHSSQMSQIGSTWNMTSVFFLGFTFPIGFIQTSLLNMLGNQTPPSNPLLRLMRETENLYSTKDQLTSISIVRQSVYFLLSLGTLGIVLYAGFQLVTLAFGPPTYEVDKSTCTCDCFDRRFKGYYFNPNVRIFPEFSSS